MFAFPYEPHELDVHPDRDKIRATITYELDQCSLRMEINVLEGELTEASREEEELKDKLKSQNEELEIALRTVVERNSSIDELKKTNNELVERLRTRS